MLVELYKINEFPGLKQNPFERCPTKPTLVTSRPRIIIEDDLVDATIYKNDIISF